VARKGEVIRPIIVAGVEKAMIAFIDTSSNSLKFASVAEGTTPSKVVEVVGPAPSRDWCDSSNTSGDVPLPTGRWDGVVDVERVRCSTQAVLTYIAGA